MQNSMNIWEIIGHKREILAKPICCWRSCPMLGVGRC